MNIRDVMTPNPPTVSPEDSIQNAARIMRDLDTGVVPVVENGRPVGLVTDRDIVVRAVAEGRDPKTTKVRDAMTADVSYCYDDQDTEEAAELMEQQQIRRLPIVDREKRLVGIVSIGDLAVKEGKDKRVGDTLQEISEGVKERG